MTTTTGTSTITRPERTVRESAVIAQLRDMIHAGWAETGIDDVWAAAQRGLGRLLVVEEDYRAETSRAVGDLLLPASGEGSDVFDDPVQDVIGLVQGSGGAVEFVAPGSLSDIGRIGLLVGRSR